MSAVTKTLLTEAEYLRRERAASFRSEFHRGEMFAMAGASFKHTMAKDNFARAIGNRLAGGTCRALTSDMRVKIPRTGLFTYPDIVAYCGQPELLDAELDTLLNPVLIVEVLSESTAAYDRGKKFEHYQAIPTLAEYVLVAQDRPWCEVFLRQPGGSWRYTPVEGLGAVLALDSVGVQVPLAEIYSGVDFDPEA
jgi:Uma2 family endonuclease